MYSSIYRKENKDEIFYDGKQNSFSYYNASKNPDNTKNSPSRMFVIVTIINSATSLVIMNLPISPLIVLFIVYCLAIVSGVCVYYLFKKRRQKFFEENRIDLKKIDNMSQIIKQIAKPMVDLIQLFLIMFTVGVTLSVIYYFDKDRILFLIMIWTMQLFSTYLVCEFLLTYFNSKKLKKIYG